MRNYVLIMLTSIGLAAAGQMSAEAACPPAPGCSNPDDAVKGLLLS